MSASETMKNKRRRTHFSLLVQFQWYSNSRGLAGRDEYDSLLHESHALVLRRLLSGGTHTVTSGSSAEGRKEGGRLQSDLLAFSLVIDRCRKSGGAEEIIESYALT
jgi:hypothetical protein